MAQNKQVGQGRSRQGSGIIVADRRRDLPPLYRGGGTLVYTRAKVSAPLAVVGITPLKNILKYKF